MRLPTGMRLVHLLLGSWTGLVMLFLYLPIALLVVYSFNRSPLSVVWTGFSTDAYVTMWRNRALIESLVNSLVIAGGTTALSVALGTGAAYLMHRYRYRFRRVIDTLVYLPVIVPEVIMGISLLVLFTAIGMSLSHLTVVIAHTTFCFPFVLIAVRARLAGIDPSLEEAALDLGATPGRAFWLVVVPYLMPAIVAGALMAFTLSMDEVIVTLFTHGPDSQTLPIVIFGLAKKGLSPELNAISTVFIAGTVLLVMAIETLRRKGPA